ncbi:hypothetical protein M422DRAFT_778266 [Sphaerobolus stellatus SS14]|uniref:Unplaced genomic scaffold SPHSTscaffold_29, whole genome shotgun sequence n=1 Tax=Sphaerobolus stellatus (strain SS14) TaxID=990650 RepID=A0A0C9VVJ1_SPHS4|nr:hypothetical protein M422DRAFT_778266 [Sphaerobolus stellatus SS14]
MDILSFGIAAVLSSHTSFLLAFDPVRIDIVYRSAPRSKDYTALCPDVRERYYVYELITRVGHIKVLETCWIQRRALSLDLFSNMADPNSQSLQITQAISDSQVASYAVVAALALLTYDNLLTLPDEINYIWCSHRWGIPSILYFMARSSCFVELASLIIPVNSFTLVEIYLFYDGTDAKLQQGMRCY